MRTRVRNYFKGKSVFFSIILATAFLSIMIAIFSTEVIHATGTPEFCSSCHEMDTFVKTYERDVHGGVNRVGVKADCVNCHLPQDSQIDYLATKVVSGSKEVAMHFSGKFSDEHYYNNRKNREEFVYSSGCISCHKKIEDGTFKTDNKKAEKVHAYYLSKKGTKDAIECASCHIDVGHNGELRKELMDIDKYLDEK